MANVTISLLEGSRFGFSPIVYRVEANNVGENAVFHRIRLKVNVNVAGYSDADFGFSSPVENGGHADFDISSALVAAAEVWEPTATPGAYPAITYTLEAVEDYMLDGVLYEGRNGDVHSGDTVYMGALSDFERMTGQRPARYSRKPTTSPEVVHEGKTLILPGPVSAAPAVSSYLIGRDSIESLNAYAITPPPDSYELRFINSFFVHESVHIIALRTATVKFDTEELVIARQETLTTFSRGLAVKQNDHEQWKMSSGPLDDAWASWFIHEVLMARWAWIKVGTVFIPCHIIPEESVPLVDRTKNDLIAIPFTIKLDITGSPT